MKLREMHAWDLTPKAAAMLQLELRRRVRLHPPAGFRARMVAGADVSCNRFSRTMFAAVVVVRLPDLEPVETRTAVCEAVFPYVPGLLAFREIPAVAEVFARLRRRPDAVMFDGHGMAHPRRMGLATHAGLILNCPTLGCAKSLLVGEPEGKLSARAGAWSPLTHQGETVGAALRTRDGVKPVYVSPGHLMDLETAVNLTLACCAGYRLPEPTRLAHIAANALRREVSEGE
jgi:deoxyribonuclease V